MAEITGSKRSAVSTISSGVVEPRKRVSVQAESFGRVTEVRVKRGDRVKAGQVLVDSSAIERGEHLVAEEHGGRAARDMLGKILPCREVLWRFAADQDHLAGGLLARGELHLLSVKPAPWGAKAKSRKS